MRRIILSTTLFLAGCAAPRPETALPQQAPTPVAAVPQPRESGAVIGMTAGDLLAHFGTPAMQVREGTSLKLQFRSQTCVLDAYLYPSPTGQRVTHLDARLPSGVDTDAQACVAQMNRGS